jgi:hypothetical protein
MPLNLMRWIVRLFCVFKDNINALKDAFLADRNARPGDKNTNNFNIRLSAKRAFVGWLDVYLSTGY